MSTPAANSGRSYFEKTSGTSIKPLWLLRGFAIMSVLPLLISLFVFKTGPRHSFCIGLAIGFMVGLIVQLFATQGIEMNQAPQASDVEDLRLTR
jgi:hypothetical protein